MPYYEFKTRCETRFDIWCGFEKWYGYAEMATFDSYDELDDKELECEFVPCSDGCKELVFPNETEYGYLRRRAKDLKIYLEFDDSGIKGKQYHSRRAIYYRTKRIKEFIEWFRGMVEKQYREVEETEPEKIEDWVKEIVEKGREYCGQEQEP